MPDPKSENPHRENLVLGMVAAMGAFLMFSFMVMFAKLLSENHSPIEIAFYRNLIAAIPFLILVYAFGHREILRINTKPIVILARAIIGAVSLTVTFAAYSLLPIADTTALLFASSLFIPIMGVVVLKESVGPYRWSAVAVGFFGVLLMANPTGDVYVFGVLVAILAAFLHAVLQIILRYLGRFETPATISFYFFVVGTLVSGLAMPFVAVTPAANEIPFFIGIGLSGALAQWLLSLAYRNAPAAVVSVFNYSSIIWATLFGWMIWNEWPLPWVLAGAAVVIASNILIIWRESRA